MTDSKCVGATCELFENVHVHGDFDNIAKHGIYFVCVIFTLSHHCNLDWHFVCVHMGIVGLDHLYNILFIFCHILANALVVGVQLYCDADPETIRALLVIDLV